jgi:hypothetical protein
MRAMAQAIQREFRCRGAKSDRGVAKSLGQGFVIPGAEQTGHELWMMAAEALFGFHGLNSAVGP